MGNGSGRGPPDEAGRLNAAPRHPRVNYNTGRRARGSWSRILWPFQSFQWARESTQRKPGNWQQASAAQNLNQNWPPPRSGYPTPPIQNSLSPADPSVDYQEPPRQSEGGRRTLPIGDLSVEDWAKQFHLHYGWPLFKGLSYYDSLLRHLEEAATYHKKLEGEIRDVNAQLSNSREECTKWNRSFENVVAKESEARETIKILLSRADAMLHKFQQREQELQEMMEAIKESCGNEISGLKRYQDTEILRLEGRHTDDISRLEGKYAAQLSTAKDEAERDLAQAKEEARCDRAQLEREKNEEIAIQAAEIRRLNLRMASCCTT